MKKLIPILLAVFALVSCEKDPDMDKLDNEYLVFTSHDTSTKFNEFSTYYIPDSILIIGDKKDPEYWKDENAQIIINAFKLPLPPSNPLMYAFQTTVNFSFCPSGAFFKLIMSASNEPVL